jgi:hypothetical protein
MTILRSLLLLLLAWPSIATANEVTLFGQGDMETMYNWAVSNEKLLAQPQWSPAAGPPPLPISKAVDLARAWMKKRHPDVKDFAIASVTLAPSNACCSGATERWYYRVEFYPIVGGQRLYGGHFIAVVLFDGTVVEPTAEKRVPVK